MSCFHLLKKKRSKDTENLQPIDWIRIDHSSVFTENEPRERRTHIFEEKNQNENATKSMKVSSNKKDKENMETKSLVFEKAKLILKSSGNQNKNYIEVSSETVSFTKNGVIPRESPLHSLNRKNLKEEEIELSSSMVNGIIPRESPLHSINRRNLKRQHIKPIEIPQELSPVHPINSIIEKQFSEKLENENENMKPLILEDENVDLFTPKDMYTYLTSEYEESKLSKSSFLSRSRLGSNVEDKKEEPFFQNPHLFEKFPIHESRVMNEMEEKFETVIETTEIILEVKSENEHCLLPLSSQCSSEIRKDELDKNFSEVSVNKEKGAFCETPELSTEEKKEVSTISPNGTSEDMVESKSLLNPFDCIEIMDSQIVIVSENEHEHEVNLINENKICEEKDTENTITELKREVCKIFERIEEVEVEEDEDLNNEEDEEINENLIECEEKEKEIKVTEEKETENENKNSFIEKEKLLEKEDQHEAVVSEEKIITIPCKQFEFFEFNEKPIRFGIERIWEGPERETHSIVSESVDFSLINDLNMSEAEVSYQELNDMPNENIEIESQKKCCELIVLLSLIGLNTLLRNNRFH